MPIPAGVKGITLVPTAITSLQVAAQRGRTADLNRIHDLPLFMRHLCAMGLPVRISVATENVGNLKGWSRHPDWLRKFLAQSPREKALW